MKNERNLEIGKVKHEKCTSIENIHNSNYIFKSNKIKIKKNEVAISSMEKRDLPVETGLSIQKYMLEPNNGITFTHQECVAVEEEEVQICRAPYFEVLSNMYKDLSDFEIRDLDTISYDNDLSFEAKYERIVEILGEPGYCTEEFLEVLPYFVFCREKCDEGYCDLASNGIKEVLRINAETLFACEINTDNVCEVFEEINQDDNSSAETRYGGFVALISMILNRFVFE
eukprot:snap_masked-scaffold_22-processed-gene-5.47-mRNA-1 protein AED:1.00 eAED:1.00 QI:0/0/0/0/1/1/3/0/227